MGRDICLIDEEDDCRISKSVYNTQCVPSKEDQHAKSSVYIGTTGRTTHARQSEHKRQFWVIRGVMLYTNIKEQPTPRNL